jgi:hypothetical protein
VVPWAVGTYPDGKYIFRRNLLGPTLPGPTAVVGGILDFGSLAAIFAGLEPAGLSYLVWFSGEGQVTPHANLDAL